MRNSRIVSTLVALILAFGLVGLVQAPAQAAKPKHDLSGVVPGKTPKGDLFIGGKIPTAAGKTLKIERKLKGKSYVSYKKTKTTGKGKFKVIVDGPVGACFKLIVPKTKDYKVTKVVVGCIVRT